MVVRTVVMFGMLDVGNLAAGASFWVNARQRTDCSGASAQRGVAR
jgi:hypothetical protein